MNELFPSPAAGLSGRRLKRARGHRVPVTVITGFLGAGKTTLLRAFLATPEGQGTAVVVNEFGATGVDDALVRASTDETVLLGNGCLCCIARTDLQQIKLNSAGYLACAVKDTGFGIAPEDQAKLFTQFFRSQNPAVREQRGTGLGLAITKSLIELQGGAIWVESELEKGSIFSFSMPVIENGEHEPMG